VILELSIDGVTKGTYEKIRRGACFESLIGRLELIRKIRDEYPECRGFLLKMHCVVMKSNVAEIEQIVDFARMYGIDELLLDKVIDFHDDVRFPREDIDRYPEILARVKAMMPHLTAAAQAAGIRLYHYFPVENGAGAAPGEKEAPGNVPVYCGVPWRRLTISTGGQIKPGCACMVPIGNVATDTLAEAWNGARMQIYRHTMAGGGAKDFCSQLCLGDMADRENAWHL
jgi:MoaA/NifB/PqqE/SkfB family radical SAM enzyme